VELAESSGETSMLSFMRWCSGCAKNHDGAGTLRFLAAELSSKRLGPRVNGPPAAWICGSCRTATGSRHHAIASPAY
jgi:hypothetical protein